MKWSSVSTRPCHRKKTEAIKILGSPVADQVEVLEGPTTSLYQGTCNLCGELEVTAEYWGETSRTGYHRTLKHQEEVVRRLEGNAFAKHLAIFHPEHEGDITKFTIKVVSSFKKPLPRKKIDAIMIRSTTADHLLILKAEHHKPALHRVRISRENDDQP